MGSGRGNCCVGNCSVGNSVGKKNNVRNGNVANCCVGDCSVGDCGVANCCVGDYGVGNTSAPTESNNTDEISNAKIRIQEMAQTTEDDLFSLVNQSTAELKDFLNQFAVEKYEEEELKFDLENLNTIEKKFIAELSGFIVAKVERRLIPEDKEVVVILGEPNNAKRRKNFEAFYERLFCNAVKDLISKTATFFQVQSESIDKDISALEKNLEDKGKHSDKLVDVHELTKQFVEDKKNSVCDVLKAHINQVKEMIPVKSIRLQDIAAELDFTTAGDDEAEIFSLKYAHEADENSLAIAYSEKDILMTKAQNVLTKPRLVPVQKNFLYCDFKEFNAAIIKVARLMIAEGIYPDYEKNFEQTARDNSMFGANVEIGEGTIIAPFVSIGENVKLGKNCRIDSGVFIGSGSRIGDNVKILSGSRVGVNCHYHYDFDGKQKSFCGVGRTIIKDGVEIGANTVIQRGTFSDTVIGAGTIIGNLVEIAHDVKIGADCLIVSQVGIAGNVTIGDRVQIFGQSGIKDWVTIGEGAIILSKSGVTKNIRAGQKVSGMFSREHKDELRRLAKLKKIIKEE
ncbi:MAG: UDP-3-O-(3-hydroxymyristoyl)glucosamine N-acyltransferase [Selenomonadaceae bacterium]|nr:UDP-3-O-(3-hydroxymyristoyl)glucosamine N-acyltransferase [Selenomonadaceae bacterium]